MCVEASGRTLDTIHQESVDRLTQELRNLNFDTGYRVRFFFEYEGLTG